MSSVLNSGTVQRYWGKVKCSEVHSCVYPQNGWKKKKPQHCDDRYCGMQEDRKQNLFFFFLTIQSSMKPTPARCYQITQSSSAFRSRPLILCLSFLWSQINSTSNKLIFSFLSLLVWNALGNYCLFWLSLFSFVRAKSINILFGNGEHLGVLFIGLHLSHPELTGVLIITVRCSRCISRT